MEVDEKAGDFCLAAGYGWQDGDLIPVMDKAVAFDDPAIADSDVAAGIMVCSGGTSLNKRGELLGLVYV